MGGDLKLFSIGLGIGALGALLVWLSHREFGDKPADVRMGLPPDERLGLMGWLLCCAAVVTCAVAIVSWVS